MRVALIQMDLAWENPDENHRRAHVRLEEAKRRGARLALLPEMFCTGFSMESEKIAQPAGGPSETFLRGAKKNPQLKVTGYGSDPSGLFTEDRGLFHERKGPERLMCSYLFTAAKGQRQALTYIWRVDGKYVFEPEVDDIAEKN